MVEEDCPRPGEGLPEADSVAEEAAAVTTGELDAEMPFKTSNKEFSSSKSLSLSCSGVVEPVGNRCSNKFFTKQANSAGNCLDC